MLAVAAAAGILAVAVVVLVEAVTVLKAVKLGQPELQIPAAVVAVVAILRVTAALVL